MPLLPSSSVGPYEILGLLGAGGMGEVYKARDSRLHRTVALKVIPSDKLADAERRRRFLHEARAASSLNHPNIVGIYDIMPAEGGDALVMEYVEGKTISQLIPKGGMKISDALRLAIQIADALAAAHAAGIVHRDLKPGNVMVTSTGTAKLLDFGLAKSVSVAEGQETLTLATSDGKTREGTVVGTANYMSPEQAEGKPVDARSDIFSFGSMLYEMVTGRRPFHGDSAVSVLSSILKDTPKRPSDLVTDLPQELERIITVCMRKDPRRRFQHADDLKIALEDLREAHESGQIVTPTVARGSKSRLWIWAALTVAGIVLIGGGWRLQTQRGRLVRESEAVPITAYPGFELQPSFSPDGTQVVFAWDPKEGMEHDIYLKLVGPGEPIQLTTDAAPEYNPVWSPDGQWIAFVRDVSGSIKHAVILIPALGGAEKPLVEFTLEMAATGWETQLGVMAALAWSPDSKWIVYPDAAVPGEAYRLFGISIETGEKRRLTNPARIYDGDRGPAFSPDGRNLCFTRVRGFSDLYLLSLSPDFRPLGERQLTFDGRENQHPSWTPDGRDIVFNSTRGGTRAMWRLSALERAEPIRIPGTDGETFFGSVARQQERLAYGRYILDSNIWRVPLDEPDASTPFITSSRNDRTPQYSPDGKRITFQSDRSGVLQIWTVYSNGERSTQLTSLGIGHTGTPRWSPDSRLVVFDSDAGGQFDIYIVHASGGAPRRLTDNPAQDSIPSWSWDGRQIYFHSVRTGRSEVWKVSASGGDAVQMTKAGGQISFESPDGKWLYYLKDSGTTPLWRMSVEGGPEERVVDAVSNRNFVVTRKGVYYIKSEATTRSSINFFDPETKKTRHIGTVSKTISHGISVSPDERWLIYGQNDQAGMDLMLIEGFK